jgi:hypothetical protein
MPYFFIPDALDVGFLQGFFNRVAEPRRIISVGRGSFDPDRDPAAL